MNILGSACKASFNLILAMQICGTAYCDTDTEIDSYLRNLKELNQPLESNYHSTEETEEISGKYFCETKQFEGAPGFSSFLFSKASSDVLYPGSLLNSESVVAKTYTPSTVDSGPITLTVNLQSIAGPISRTIDNPAYSTVQSAIHEILSQNIVGDAGAEMSWSVDNVYSKEHMKSKLGMDFKVGDVFGAGGSLGLDFSSNTKKAVIHFNQKYYDVVIDLPKKPTDLLAPDITLDEIKSATDTHSPAYVSSVSYGRYVLFTFETSDLSMNLEQELKAAITVPTEGANIKASTNSKIDAGFKSGSLKSNAYILGGSGERASMAINSLDAMIEFIKTGGRYSKDSPGKPISYSLRYLSNNSPLRIVRSTEYSERDCVRIYNNYRVDILGFQIEKVQGAALPQIDLSGTVSAKGSTGDPAVLWSKKLLQYPIRIGEQNAKNVNATASLNFESLKPAARKDAYIDLDMNMRASWGIFPENFYPQTKRIYLRDITGDALTEELKTQWHKLILTYQITGTD